MTLIRLWIMTFLIGLAIVGCNQVVAPATSPDVSPTTPPPFATSTVMQPIGERTATSTGMELPASVSLTPIPAPTLARTSTATPVKEKAAIVLGEIDWIACLGWERDIWLINPTNGEKQRLTHLSRASSGPAWSPDGTKLVFGVGDYFDSEPGPIDLAIIDLITGDLSYVGLNYHEGSDLPKTRPYPIMTVGWPAWTMDGATIYYSITTDGLKRTWQLRQVHLDGGGEEDVPLVSDGFDYWWESSPAFSPDGRWLTYGLMLKNGVGLLPEEMEGNWGIWLADVSGDNAPWRIVDVLGKSAWSPDSTQIAYDSDSGTSGIFVVNIDGSNVRRLTDTGHYPTWSPNGQQIAFQKSNDDLLTSEVWLVNADGSSLHKLSDCAQPAWRPMQRQ
jgi:Tol biopolymer transport system component